MRSTKLCVTLSLVLVCLIQSQASAQFEKLCNFLPSRANAIAFLNMDKIYSSGFATKEKWLVDAKVRWDNNPLFYPAATKSVVLAAELNFDSGEVLWEASFMDMKKKIDLESIENKVGNKVEIVGSYPAVQTFDGSFILKLDTNIIASVFPANRQYVSKWSNSVKNGTAGNLSPYLHAAATYASNEGAGTEIILAVDMEHVVDIEQIKEKLKDVEELLKPYNVTIDQMAETLSSIKGVTLGIRVGDQPTGRLKVDFDQDAKCLEGPGRALLLSVLDRWGALVDGMETWTQEINGNQFSLKGNLDTNGLRQIASIIEPPPMQVDSESYAGGTESSGTKSMAESTKDYFQAVDKMVRGLKPRGQATKGAAALYFERYARRIDRLPVLNVDDQMLEFGAQVADTLRGVGSNERGVAIESSANDKVVQEWSGAWGGGGGGGSWGTVGRTYGGGGYGRRRGGSFAGASRVANANLIAQGAKNKYAMLGEIDELTRDIRVQMSRKYEIEF